LTTHVLNEHDDFLMCQFHVMWRT